MEKADSRGGKLNNRAVSACRTGLQKARAGLAGLARKMRLWQKAGLLICVLFWISSYVIGIVCARLTEGMPDQNYASRWALEGGSSQVSAFFSDNALFSDESVDAMQMYLSGKMMEASLGLSEQQIENGARLYDVCYSGLGMTEISTPSDSVTVTAIGVGGDFFNFHPLNLMSGYYFSEDESMKDRILLDDRTAWRLFGSPYIVGESVDIGGISHYIAGVFKAPTERFYKQSGMGDYLVYISYDSLCKYTEKGTPGGSDGSEGTDDSMMDAFAPAEQFTPAQNFVPAESAPAENTPAENAPAENEIAVDAGGGTAMRKVVLPQAGRTAMWKPETGPAVTASADGRLVAFDSVNDLADQDAGEEDGGAGSGEENTASGSAGGSPGSDEGEVGEDDDRITADDTPVGESLNRGDSSYPGSGDGEGKAEVNRARISCYEAVLPNPITHFALNTLKSCLTENGVDAGQMTVVENTGRFDARRLALMMAQPGLRSMQSMAIRYPYWENVALAWEDVLIPFAFLELFMRFSPFLFLLFLLLWYATHRSWTVGGWIQKAREKMYDRQAERIYGSSPETEALAREAGADPEVLPEDAEASPADSDPKGTLPGAESGPEPVQADTGTPPEDTAGKTQEQMPAESGSEDRNTPPSPEEPAGNTPDQNSARL